MNETNSKVAGDAASAESISQRIEARGGRALAVKADVSDSKAVLRASGGIV